MATLTLLHTILLPDSLDHLVPGPDATVVAQVGVELYAVDLRSGTALAAGELEPGHQLVGLGADTRTEFDPEGNLVITSLPRLAAGDPEAVRTVPLGEEAEFVSAEPFDNGLVLLIAESVGNPLELGIPQFTFVTVDPGGEASPLGEVLSQAPDLWLLDRANGQLIVFTDLDTGPPTVTDLVTGEPVEVPPGLARGYNRYRLTGAGLAPDGTRLAVSLWHDERNFGELRVVDATTGDDRLVSVFSNEKGVPLDPRWDPEGKGFTFRMETDRGNTIHWAAPEGKDWKTGKLSDMESLGASLWQGRHLLVQIEENELAVFTPPTED